MQMLLMGRAIRPIAAGEQLFMSYGDSFWDDKAPLVDHQDHTFIRCVQGERPRLVGEILAFKFLQEFILIFCQVMESAPYSQRQNIASVTGNLIIRSRI